MTTLRFADLRFATVSELIAINARECPEKVAIRRGSTAITYRELHRCTGRMAAALQRDAIGLHDAIAIVSSDSLASTLIVLGAVRAGCVAVPIAPSVLPEQMAAMIANSGASLVFLDTDIAGNVPILGTKVVYTEAFDRWLTSTEGKAQVIDVLPTDPFNIIYSSGTTGTPKGIVQTHAMRWNQIAAYGQLAPRCDLSVTLIATPIYSNTTLVCLLPTLAYGGTVVLMDKFDAYGFLVEAERVHATHTMLVPVQYQRIMAQQDFDSFDLEHFVFKACTGAPFSAELKADVVRRWPGALLEIYGMTEGGGTCLLSAHQFPDKLHTVGRPAPGCEIRLIDTQGREVAAGEIGEVVGRSNMMMSGYHGHVTASREAGWLDVDGNLYIRHGDLGRFDEEGFLVLLGRTKDMIISGGFNVYPSDIEAALRTHPDVEDCAVIGVPCAVWGETPYAFYVPRGESVASQEVLAWVNARVGKTQRLSGAQTIEKLPMNAAGKVLKRELREQYLAHFPAASQG
ncbi:TPA: class I adenylate-forming enzyme family protein [Serratia marcescens]|uniref:class I adenylate-forming enzyme family protein n=1 Tax=Serratia ureilytica TaxID=300181 RepID=UPI0018D88F8E|nr:class I adenylate-forming enzyme family protein [Serratia ureilytica]MBH3319153.1 acyl--CoA ligase [Serratia ureilytica]